MATGEYQQIMNHWGVEAGMITTPVIDGAYG